MPAALTAFGAVTGHGLGCAVLVEAVLAGRTAARKVTRFPALELCSELAVEAPDDAALVEAARPLAVPPAGDRATRLLLAAAAEAMAGRRLEPSPRRGVVVGSTKGAFEASLAAWESGRPAERDPLAAPAAALAAAVGARGPVRAVGAACASSTAAIGEALGLIERGTCDEVVVGGCEGLSPFVYAGFHALKAMSPSPAAPFDAHRGGLTLGEGAGVMVLEAASAGRRAVAWVDGYGGAADGHDQTAPDPKALDTNAVQDVLFKVGGVEVQEFLDAPGPDAGYGLEPPALKVSLRLEGGKPPVWLKLGLKDGCRHEAAGH